jgi:hypothetical protein
MSQLAAMDSSSATERAADETGEQSALFAIVLSERKVQRAAERRTMRCFQARVAASAEGENGQYRI